MPSKTIVAIICITIILVTCLIMGQNGALIGVGCSAIAALGGWAAHKKKEP